MRRLDMHRLQELVRLHRMGTGAREVSRLLGMSPNTEREYRRALGLAALLEGPVDVLPELAVLREAVTSRKTGEAPQHESTVAKWADRVAGMLADGATPTAIHDRLKLEDKDFAGSLSAIKRLCGRLRKAKGVDPKDVAIPVDTEAGEVAQVDFGSVGKLWDPDTGRMRQAYVFVMVLGFSRHMVARIVFDQKVDTWLRLHVEAFEELGAVPRVVVPDNLKSAVIRAAFGVTATPVLNRSYRELARHYGFKIDPTPPYAPEKKGKVESGVKYAKQNFFAARREVKDVAVLREQLSRWVVEVAGARVHGTTHRRPLEVFEQVERMAMLPLPAVAWTPVLWRTPTLRRDCLALVELARYSAPWRLVGKELLARVTAHSVELYFEDVRVATHERQPPGGRSIQDEHLPPERCEYRKRTREYWEERAAELGDDVHVYIRELFDSDDVLHQLHPAQAIVRHLATFPVERARAACRRARFYGCYGYGAIKNILRKGLDLEPLPPAIVPATDPGDRPRFARNVQELLDFTKEEHDASH